MVENISVIDEIADLILNLPWNERITMQLDLVDNHVSYLCEKSPLSDVSAVRSEMRSLVRGYLDKSSVSESEMIGVREDISNIRFKIFASTRNMKIYLMMLELENMIVLKYLNFDRERRKEIRLPVLLDAVIHIPERDVFVTLIEVSADTLWFSTVDSGLRNFSESSEITFSTALRHRVKLKSLYLRDDISFSDHTVHNIGGYIDGKISMDDISEIIHYCHNRHEIARMLGEI
jgi:hypothetical protein